MQPARSGPKGMFRIIQAVAVAASFAACAEDSDDSDHDANSEESTPSGAVCSSNSTLDYDTFGKGFMDKYCVRCHSSTLKGTARNGAPDGHDFDKLAGITPVMEHIDQKAASGPQNVNTAMPPSDPKPTDEERRKLGEWLACEMAK